jgi:hypothetical protein
MTPKLGITKADVEFLSPEAKVVAAQMFRKAGHDPAQLLELFGPIVSAEPTREEGNAKAKAAFQNVGFTATTHYGRQI